mmetsp:Transcript_14938/g.47926  ORF Transcript_14938/g.47926 Transcript_14938/m.47926 type:complete len:248 (-) Transcript_14938:417-1160(-)
MIKEEMHGKVVKGLDPSLVAEVNRQAPNYREEQFLVFHEEMRYKAFKSLDKSVIEAVRYEVAEHEEQLMEFKAEMHGKAFNALDAFMVEAVKNQVVEHAQRELAEFKAVDEMYSEHEQQLNSEFKAEMHGKAFKALDPELIAKVLKEVQANDEQEARTMERANVGAKMRIEPDVVESNRARDQFFSNLEQALDSGALEKVLEEIFLEEEEEEEPQAPPILKARGRFKRPGMLHRATLPGICEFEDSD